MKFSERLKYVILPASFFIGMGILQIKFPHAMDNFDDGYTGKGIAGVIMLFVELFLMLTWGKIMGFITTFLGVIMILIGLWLTKPDSKTLEAVTVNNSDFKTERITTKVAKAIALAYMEETSETKAADKTKEKSGQKSRLLGKTARSLAKRYLDRQ